MFCIIGFVIDYGVLSYVHAKLGFLFYDVCLVMNEKNGIFFFESSKPSYFLANCLCFDLYYRIFCDMLVI